MILDKNNLYVFFKDYIGSEYYVGLHGINDIPDIYNEYINMSKKEKAENIMKIGLINKRGTTMSLTAKFFGNLQDDNSEKINLFNNYKFSNSGDEVIVIIAIPYFFKNSKGENYFGGYKPYHSYTIPQSAECISDYLFRENIPPEMILGYYTYNSKNNDTKVSFIENKRHYSKLNQEEKDEFIKKYRFVFDINNEKSKEDILFSFIDGFKKTIIQYNSIKEQTGDLDRFKTKNFVKKNSESQIKKRQEDIKKNDEINSILSSKCINLFNYYINRKDYIQHNHFKSSYYGMEIKNINFMLKSIKKMIDTNNFSLIIKDNNINSINDYDELIDSFIKTKESSINNIVQRHNFIIERLTKKNWVDAINNHEIKKVDINKIKDDINNSNDINNLLKIYKYIKSTLYTQYYDINDILINELNLVIKKILELCKTNSIIEPDPNDPNNPQIEDLGYDKERIKELIIENEYFEILKEIIDLKNPDVLQFIITGVNIYIELFNIEVDNAINSNDIYLLKSYINKFEDVINEFDSLIDKKCTKKGFLMSRLKNTFTEALKKYDDIRDDDNYSSTTNNQNVIKTEFNKEKKARALPLH